LLLSLETGNLIWLGLAAFRLEHKLRMITSYVQLLSKRYKGHLDADHP
jgi:hypothetical protein